MRRIRQIAATLALLLAALPAVWAQNRVVSGTVLDTGQQPVVGAAVILNRKNQIMIAQRKPEGGMLAGLWEFPGGKIAPGETMPQCIARELKEEMGLDLEVGPELVVVHHAYSHFTIALHAHFARIVKGRPRHIDCAGHTWTTLSRIDDYPFSKADLQIIAALRALPRPPRYRDYFP